jgi:hypothetical protein
VKSSSRVHIITCALQKYRAEPDCPDIAKMKFSLGELPEQPRRADRNLGSFKVNRFNGRCCDFATGDNGDNRISLVAHMEGITTSGFRE